jgi:hypothetical protein
MIAVRCQISPDPTRGRDATRYDATMDRRIIFLLGIALLGAAWHLAHRTPSAVDLGPGVLAPDPPRQTELSAQPVIRHGDYQLQPLAEFVVRARLLSSERYDYDRGASLSPIDFALGWGRMSDGEVADALNISQGVRFFSYRWSDQPPIPPEEITRSATNAHLIPADDAIRAALFRMSPGSVVEIRGLLVNAKAEDGFYWNSSLSRTDSGAGACELIYVTRASVIRQ